MEHRLLLRIRVLIGIVIVGLVISGLTAFALETELKWLTSVLGVGENAAAGEYTGIKGWLGTIREALIETNARYPFMAYATDWLAFAHLVIAVIFLGPLFDPQRNIWIVISGLIACGGVILLAMIAGSIRGIPMSWRLIDCSFGVLCAIPLVLAWRWTRQLDRLPGPQE